MAQERCIEGKLLRAKREWVQLASHEVTCGRCFGVSFIESEQPEWLDTETGGYRA